MDLVTRDFSSSRKASLEEDEKAFFVSLGVPAGDWNAAAQRTAGKNPRDAFRAFQRARIWHEWLRGQFAQELPDLFLKHKDSLDRIVYSLLRVRDANWARELYLRIREGEQTFQQIASLHSEGPEQHSLGILGPVAAGAPHESLSKILRTLQPGELAAPQKLGEWTVVVRLEKKIPAVLDEETEKWLLERAGEDWILSLFQTEKETPLRDR